MNDAQFSKLCTMLRALPSNQPWSDGHRQVYAVVIEKWEDDFARQVIETALTTEEWRPPPARLLAIAVRLLAQYPSAEEAYAEILCKVQRFGAYGRPIAGRASAYLPGPPSMSHPMVAQIVGHLGGWEMICSGEAGRQEGLIKQVRESHRGLSAEWEGRVRSQLTLPPSRRDPELFRARPKFVLPPGFLPPSEGDMEEAPALGPGRQEGKTPMPEHVVRTLREHGFERVGKTFAADVSQA